LTHTTPFAAGNKVTITEGTLALDRSSEIEDSYTFNQKLTGAGTLAVTLGEKTDKLTFGDATENAFAGTVALEKGTIELDGTYNKNTAALTEATVKLSINSVADIKSDSTLKNLTTNGGTVKFTTNEISPNAQLNVTRNLDVSGGVTLDLSPGITGAIDTSALASQNFYDYSTANSNYQQELISVAGNVTGTSGDITLNPTTNNAQSRTINDGSSNVGTATFDYNASVKNDVTGKGVYLGYGLKQIEADNSKTVTLDATGSTSDTLYAN
jgi:hypothetical protein